MRSHLTCELVAAHSNRSCDSLIVKRKTLDLLLIVNYWLPDASGEEFEEQLNVCQDSIDTTTEKDPKVKDVTKLETMI